MSSRARQPDAEKHCVSQALPAVHGNERPARQKTSPTACPHGSAPACKRKQEPGWAQQWLGESAGKRSAAVPRWCLQVHAAEGVAHGIEGVAEKLHIVGHHGQQAQQARQGGAGGEGLRIAKAAEGRDIGGVEKEEEDEEVRPQQLSS
jgi:hypothetical protein